MEYKGKLYGQISESEYFYTGKTADDYDELEAIKSKVFELLLFCNSSGELTQGVRTSDILKSLYAIKQVSEGGERIPSKQKSESLDFIEMLPEQKSESLDFIEMLQQKINKNCGTCGNIEKSGWKDCGCQQEGFNEGVKTAIELFKSFYAVPEVDKESLIKYRDDFSLEFMDYSKLSYYDSGEDCVELFLDGKRVGGLLVVSTDSENENREYIIINYEIIYLDTIKRLTNKQMVWLEQDITDEKTRKDVLETFKSGDDISVSYIQRKCRCGYNTASRTFNKLVDEKRIMKGEGIGMSKFI